MNEKELAYKIANAVAKSIVDECGGITLSGAQLANKYAERCYEKGDVEEIMSVVFKSMALTHWVACVGYDKQCEFKIIMNTSIQNC